MVIIWRPEASETLKIIYDFYFVKDAKAAGKILTSILEAVDRLSFFPEMAPVEPLLAGEPEKYRSMVAHKLFKVVYTVDMTRKEVVIADIWDCRQNPAKLRENVLKKSK